MRRFLVSLLILSSTAAAAAKKAATECLGPTEAKGYLIYLHGFTPPDQQTKEEGENRGVLEQLARDHALRIAMPRGPLCPSGQLCWPARDRDETLRTFADLREQAQSCWKGHPAYSLVGFSNGGYFALKLYKAHADPQLMRIVASGSAGTWDPRLDKPHPASSFALMIGEQDITLSKATRLADELRRSIRGFRFEKFRGAHRLDYKTLSHLVAPQKP